MFPKMILYTFLVVCFLQLIAVKGNEIDGREYVTIDGHEYFVDWMIFYNRDDARVQCQSLNMTLVTFDTAEKYNTIMTRLQELGFYQTFWTGGMRDVGSSTWYWEATGEPITEFFWAENQPSWDQVLDTRMCMDFKADGIVGWSDKDCDIYYLSAFCQ